MSGEKQSSSSSDNEDKKLHSSERYYGRFQRSWTVGDEVDESDVAASLANGVLHLSIQKKAPSRSQDPKKIEIKVQ